MHSKQKQNKSTPITACVKSQSSTFQKSNYISHILTIYYYAFLYFIIIIIIILHLFSGNVNITYSTES